MPAERPERESTSLYWGDFHKHLTAIDDADEIVAAAAAHLDVYAVLCYPFRWYREGELRVETTGGRPEHESWWERLQAVARRHHEPGEFVTYPAYEWHGDRTRWGDHNVIYRREGYPIDDERDLPDLYGNLREREALALPHHTGYRRGNRGGDWDVFESDRSPVMEVYSTHGSSESVDSPVGMDANRSMGPRTSGGTLVDALDRGHRVGVIASNDGSGLPGTWGRGLAGLWATELTREGIWEALRSRRTYGVTGDRMTLWWTVDGEPMGTVLDERPVESIVEVDCPRPLDRVELLRNGQIHETYCHRGTGNGADRRERRNGTDERGVYRLPVEFGWGPAPRYGFERCAIEWNGRIAVDGGRLRRVVPRFTGLGQRYDVEGDVCAFELRTSRGGGRATLGDDENPEDDYAHYWAGFVLEVDADRDAELRVAANGESLVVPIADAVERDHLLAMEDRAARRIEESFGVTRSDVDNRDVFFHSAPKIRVGRAAPKTACAATVAFDVSDAAAGDYLYVRASQVDGQYAWSSPIWID